MKITVENAVKSVNNNEKISINIDKSTILTEQFIDFEVTETFDPPKLVEVYNNDELGFTDCGCDYEKVYRVKTLYRANKFELYLCGYFADRGHGKFGGWSTEFDIEKESLNNFYHKYMLKEFGIKYAKELNAYAKIKLGEPRTDRNYWQKIYKITNEKIKRAENNQKKNQNTQVM